jgi:hypothetical protein
MDLSLLSDIIKGYLTGFFREMKIIPHNALSAFFLWGVAWTAYIFVYPKIIMAADIVPQVASLQASVEKLNATLVVDKMDRNIRSIDAEMYTIRREIDSLSAKKLEVPEPLLSRINVLGYEKARAEQQLVLFTQRNVKLLEPAP